jgi:hypothetical protein
MAAKNSALLGRVANDPSVWAFRKQPTNYALIDSMFFFLHQ